MKVSTSSAEILRIDLPCIKSYSAWNAKERTDLLIIIEWKMTTDLYVRVNFVLKSVLGAHFVNVKLWAGKLNTSSACAFSSYFQSSSAYL